MSAALERAIEALKAPNARIDHSLREYLIATLELVRGGNPAGLHLPTAVEQEALSLLAEECAELIHMICKALRHGMNSSNPTLPPEEQRDNRWLIEQELGQVLAAGRLACEVCLSTQHVEGHMSDKLNNVGVYLHNPENQQALLRLKERIEADKW